MPVEQFLAVGFGTFALVAITILWFIYKETIDKNISLETELERLKSDNKELYLINAKQAARLNFYKNIAADTANISDEHKNNISNLNISNRDKKVKCLDREV